MWPDARMSVPLGGRNLPNRLGMTGLSPIRLSPSSVLDQLLPFRLGHVYGRYLQKRPLMGFRPSTHIVRSKAILCIRLRTHIACCATPFGSLTSSSLWGRFGKDRFETDFGKTATYKHRKNHCARTIPSHWKFVFENGQSRTSICGVPDARSETGVRYFLTCRCTTVPTDSG